MFSEPERLTTLKGVSAGRLRSRLTRFSTVLAKSATRTPETFSIEVKFFPSSSEMFCPLA